MGNLQISQKQQTTIVKTTSRDMLNRPMGVKEWGLILVLSVLWGGSFFFVGIAVKEVPPLTIVLCRVALAALILLAVVHLRGEQMPHSPGVWVGFFVMGGLNNIIPFNLIVWGQTHITSGLASILNATTPIFSVILAHFLTKEEKLTLQRVLGILLGWTGVTLMIGFETARGFGTSAASQLAVLGAALSYACAAIYGRRFKGINPLVVATGMLCGSAILMTPLTLWIDRPWNIGASMISLLAILGLAAVSTAVAYIIYFRILSTAGPTNLLLVTFLIPVSAILLGTFILGEHLAGVTFAGMAMIFIGLLTIDGRLLKKLRRL